jgi:predicted short-subunit dehydrogenase-like oxidoreductase (DUF2520 family)
MLAVMPRARIKPLTVSVVAPGRLGTALALNLPKAGYQVRVLVTCSSRPASQETAKLARQVRAKVVTLGESPLDTGLVWITVPDDAIPAVAAQLASSQRWRGKTVFHSSGALTSDVLSPLREKGAKVASVHPGMTFVRQSVPRLQGVPFGVEGDAAAVRLAKKIIGDLGGTTHPIAKKDKVMYHAFGSFASPMLIALLVALEQVGKAAGIKPENLSKMARPLLLQTLGNYLEHGAAEAFSGPLVRGDAATIRRHLDALRKVPEARAVYVALARMAVKDLPVRNQEAVERELGRSSSRL